ncbi:MAG: putative porin [Marinilabiliaceae bacterium]
MKYEHVNNHWGSNDYFHTIHYPANPATFKFGLSWNFYD